MNSIRTLCKIPGRHQIFINSKTPITENKIRRLIPDDVLNIKIEIEGPRNLWNDVKEFWCAHVGIVIFTGGLSLFGYLGFWLYEKWKPLYIVHITTGFTINPLV